MTTIPNGWQLVKLGEIARVYSGGTPSRSLPKYWGGRIPWVSTTEIDSAVITSTKETITEAGLANSSTKIAPAGTLLMAMYGQGKTRGKTSILGIDAAMNQACAAIETGRKVDPKYLLAYLQANYDRIRSLSNSGSQENLSGEIVKKIPVLLPDDIREQRQIANNIDHATLLIETLERLIAKKQAIKQGMVQQLLAGKTRLPGSTKTWREVHLREVLTVRHGKSQKMVETPRGRYPILATGGQIGWTNTPLYSKPSVLIGRKGTIDRPQYQAAPFWTVDTLFYTEISPSADPRYLYYVFTTIDWRSMNEASGVPSLSSSRVESVEIQLPGIDEQRAIRAVLDDADSEIVAVQARLVKAKAIKQGMMQELLSGRTRLPIKEVAS